jgi:ribonuclease VapC
MSADAAQHARRAYARYGRGVGSPAVLNYGDCLSYGVAVAAGEPLLFKGSDFTATDVDPARY